MQFHFSNSSKSLVVLLSFCLLAKRALIRLYMLVRFLRFQKLSKNVCDVIPMMKEKKWGSDDLTNFRNKP
jgi:hypothetical protein